MDPRGEGAQWNAGSVEVHTVDRSAPSSLKSYDRKDSRIKAMANSRMVEASSEHLPRADIMDRVSHINNQVHGVDLLVLGEKDPMVFSRVISRSSGTMGKPT